MLARADVLSEGSSWEKIKFQAHIVFVARIHFLVAIGLKNSISSWMFAKGCPQLLANIGLSTRLLNSSKSLRKTEVTILCNGHGSNITSHLQCYLG